ncbi:MULTISPECIES: TlpA disulfide reductase family protein [Sphingobacterium]|uniref:TlpA family protein disulfide reductase n=1 Tax=Sphingobacterium TaxID=28453 RepID=UPI00161374A7|nr:TlpA disulfide reductase family protein [Sphingobacterium sp. JUb56]MBB2951709.1 thiol-disulfide isomerase/thioredoxin [Sphingobacterium sp. JUb56]
MAHAQDTAQVSFNIADPAPSLYVQEWLKGTPIQQFEKGRIYVIEFWATWCKPCIAAMPHLSALASKYKNKITIIGVSVYETKNTSTKEIQAFVNSMGDKMTYHVAIDSNNQMVDNWIHAFGEKSNGIPRSFVVNAEGRIAWIGHPNGLDAILTKMIADKWNINKALKDRNNEIQLNLLKSEASYSLLNHRYELDKLKIGDAEKAILTLNKVNEIVKEEPNLKNTGLINFYIFKSLLYIDQKKAHDYGKSMLKSNDNKYLYYDIIEALTYKEDSLKLQPEIYLLGAEAYQIEIKNVDDATLEDISQYYKNMAKWYWKANNRSKAVKAQKKSIKVLKNRQNYSTSDLSALESQLHQYKQKEVN